MTSCYVVKNIRYAEDVKGANCLPIIAEEEGEDVLAETGEVLIGDECYYLRNFIFPNQSTEDAFTMCEEDLDELIRELIMNQHYADGPQYAARDGARDDVPDDWVYKEFHIVSYDEVDIITEEEYEAMTMDGVEGYVKDGVRRWSENLTM